MPFIVASLLALTAVSGVVVTSQSAAAGVIQPVATLESKSMYPPLLAPYSLRPSLW